jgi:hypothetical protein
MNGEPTRRRPISLAELAGVPPRRRATLAVDTGRWLREVTARAHLPAELLSALVQAYVVTVLREPQAKTPEGRSAVLRDIRNLLEDAVFAGIKAARSPDPEKRPLPPTPLG